MTCTLCNGRLTVPSDPGAQHLTIALCDCARSCPRCDGEGNVVVTDDRGYDFLHPCGDCSPARERVWLVNHARIPRRLQHATLDIYAPADPSQVAALQRCREWLHLFRPGANGINFAGPTGTGKSHLVVAIVKRLIAQRVRCLFVRQVDVLEGFKSRFDRGELSAAEYRSYLCTVPVLVLDEIDELTTDWQRSVISDLIEGRYNARKTTLATTNLKPGEIPSMFGPGGERIASRLMEMAPVVKVQGPDARETGVAA